MVAVESGSMTPHLNIGDVVVIVSPSKKSIVTWVEGKKINYKSFGDYGDVIVYYRKGNRDLTPIIHRVITWVNKGQPIVGINRTTGKLGELRIYHNMLVITNKPIGKVIIARSSGYITQGDHNPIPDEPELTPPVKPNWILGVAVYRIPYAGYPRLIIQKLI
ncbi:MAG: S26 family signal peptidase [Archaeoglobus sp.]|nr:MAG: S26 family signal peptidase [Archaeoglobus sp.]